MRTDAAQSLYRASDGHVRSTFAAGADEAVGYYRRYVDFVLSQLPSRPARILDIGCGSGWSTWLMRAQGHQAIGMDLHSRPLEAQRQEPGLPYASGDVQRLPFADGVFDVAAMYQVLEHVPDPERGLSECVRVLRPGGRLVVVGPNLLSVGTASRVVARETVRALRNGGRWTRRTPEMPRHPFGNTLPETYEHWWHHLRHSTRKLRGGRPVEFLRREPDTRPPFNADNDASYYCNPMDLRLWAEQTPGLRAVRWWPRDRAGARWLWPVHGGTWVVIEKAG